MKLCNSYKTVQQLENRIEVTQMGSSWKKIVDSQKNALPLEKYDTGRKMCHSQKNGSRLQMCFTVTKMLHNWKNGSQLEKCVTVSRRVTNMSQLKKWVQVRKISQKLEKCVTVRKTGHSQKDVTQLAKWVRGRNIGYCQKNCVTVNNMWHKNLSQLEKWVTVGKMCLQRTKVFKYYAHSIVVPNAYLDRSLLETKPVFL